MARLGEPRQRETRELHFGRRSRAAVCGAVAAGLVSAALLVHLALGGKAIKPPDRASPPPWPGQTFAARAVKLSRELLSGSTAELRDAIAMPAGMPLDPAAARSLAALKRLTFQTKTFRQRSAAIATVQVLLTDASGFQRAWNVTLVRDNGEWKLAGSAATRS